MRITFTRHVFLERMRQVVLKNKHLHVSRCAVFETELHVKILAGFQKGETHGSSCDAAVLEQRSHLCLHMD